VHVASVYLFTWNLGTDAPGQAHDLTVEHLARRATTHPFVACLQEIPARSLIGEARRGRNPGLFARRIAVVETAKLGSRIALAYHSDLTVLDAHADEDNEFVAAVFQLPSSNKQLRVVGLHATSQVRMPQPADQGGARALLRHAINAILQRSPAHHTVVLGDFNSEITSREMQSWNCFYALSEHRPRTGPSFRRRRGLDHAPLYAVWPQNKAMGTFVLDDTGGTSPLTVDFIAVDEETRPRASSRILAEVATKTIWDIEGERPNLSDHLPVEGFVDI
jgi:endonuclease/exonuclease/phosphatase family metal-dependent hydrolase